MDNSDDVGILPSTLGKATRINGGGLFSAVINDTEPECKKVKLKCHILNKYKPKKLIIFSRDELKQHNMRLIFKNNNTKR